MKYFKSPISYRNDINGLRAWAVVAVLLFHFRVPGFSAGFMGVDLFFVISGYLMTAIVIKGLEGEKFSLLQFYLARVRRIMPALIVLLLVLLVLGWFWLPTPSYQQLGTQSVYSLGFVSNIYFWRTTGYFGEAAHNKWLLHTWTLGVEFQFYLLYPIFLLLLWKIKPSVRVLLIGISLAFIASLALSVVLSSWKPEASFYLLPTRGWEFLAGGLSLLILREFPTFCRLAPALLWTGLVFWITALVVLDSSFTWPAAWAMLPVLSACLVIIAQQEKSILTVNPIMKWLGDRSYSLYLWHWPIVAALYFVGMEEELVWVLAGIALSLILSDLSYRLVEIPTRLQLAKLSLSKELVAFVLTGLIVIVFAMAVRSFEIEGRLPESVELAAKEVNNIDPRRRTCEAAFDRLVPPGCSYGVGKISAILMGDSHALSAVTALGEAAEKHGRSIVSWAMNSCPTLDGVRFKDRKLNSCGQLNKWADKELSKHPEIPLILISRTSAYAMGLNEPGRLGENREAFLYFTKKYQYASDASYRAEFTKVLTETACRLAKDRTVYVVRPVPEYVKNVPGMLSREIMFKSGNEDIKIPLAEYHERNKLVWQAQDKAAKQCGVKILDVLPYLCDKQYCYGSNKGRPMYVDDNHLSEYGNKFLVPMFEEVFRNR